MYVNVVLPLPLPRPFTYRLPAGKKAEVGCRVLVPFGSRRLTGLVVERAADAGGVDEVKDVLDVLDEKPSFSEELLALTRWMAEYYVCSWGEVVRAILPAGTTSGGASPGIKTELHVRFAPAYGHPRAVDELRTELPGAKQVAVVESLAGYRAEGLREPRQADLLARADAPHSTIQSLIKRGVLERVDKEVVRTPLDEVDADSPLADSPLAAHVMHPGQVAALQEISAAVDAGRFHAFLLHGVTGSGKTEVYIEALKRTLERGRTGIVLVPEIALTPQTVRRFQGHFGDRIAVFHSRMSPGERFDAWRMLRDGRLDIVIGPRSAVLVPLSNVGLIVVDEEHDQSYKQQDPAPRYHARDVAVMRAHIDEAVCLLGSATPSLESYYNARGGKYTLLQMPERVPLPEGETASLPDVRILDLRRKKTPGVLSDFLVDAIRERLERAEQVILLQNRRGYAPLLECSSCGWSPECPDCSVTMTLHKSKRHLRCHYCGRTARIPQCCPSCSANGLEMLGTGTQRVEEELEERFPEARIVRMDHDTTTGKNAHDRLLQQFGRGDADILLGTQMVAKGLDFANVTLVGVINADTGLLLPDFRSEERTFQLLSQVAGRAGRAVLPGEVIIQTRNPDRPIIRYARDHDYDTFAEAQLADRHALSYPPFGRLACVEFKGARVGDAAELSRRWTAVLRQRASGMDVLGPEEAFISRVKKQYRFHTIVKSHRSGKDAGLQSVLRATAEAAGNPPRGCRVNIDVDPVGLF